MEKLYTIEKCRDKDDFDNGCYLPSDGGLYTKEKAIKILENTNGGIIIASNGSSYMVNYDRTENTWLETI